MVKEYDSEVLALRDRVRKGNDKLWDAWRVIRDIQDPERKEEMYTLWLKRVEFLNKLSRELYLRGYNECLYIDENGKKTVGCLYNPDNPEWFCNACPCQWEPGGSKYWEKELLSLPGPKARQSAQRSQQAEFLGKMGGA